MKIGRYVAPSAELRLGVVLAQGDDLQVLDLRAASERRHGHAGATKSMNDFIDGGRAALDDAYATVDWARERREAAWFADEAGVRWAVPLDIRNCLAVGRNFAKHVAEAREHAEKRGIPAAHFDFPTGFSKLVSNMVPTRSEVARPADVTMLDYEIEAVAVIGRTVSGTSLAEAREAVFGYTVMNDLSAREWQRREMDNQLLLLGKNFPGFGPIGPWILTADEVPDPSRLVLSLTVNGEQRQRSACDCMIFSFDTIIAHWSRIGLARGDVVTSGTPEGVAVGFKPDPAPWFLKPGDVVHASVEQIGTLETRIV